jgi:uncharacterized protein YecT (DUF1311 family)
MRTLLVILVLLVLGCATKGALADDVKLCDDGSFLEQRNCSERESKKAQVALETAYQRLVKLIPLAYQPEKDPSASGEASAGEVLEALENSQRAWLSYRKAACAYEYQMARGGTGTASDHQERLCVAQLTLQRVKHLNTEAKNLESALSAIRRK